MENCVFCKIINKELPSEIMYEDSKFMVFKDIKPKAPIHLLLVPKKHIPSVDHLDVKDKILMGELILTTQKIAQDNNLKGYKILINVGRSGGQIIDHLHFHLMSGSPIGLP